ncbi:MAG: hypothetical protein ACE14T_11045 [Syntrophales bacterium]
MDLGDVVMVDNARHPLNGCIGKIVGRRGRRELEDIWYLVYIGSRMRSYLIPRSMLKSTAGEIGYPVNRGLH